MQHVVLLSAMLAALVQGARSAWIEARGQRERPPVTLGVGTRHRLRFLNILPAAVAAEAEVMDAHRAARR